MLRRRGRRSRRAAPRRTRASSLTTSPPASELRARTRRRAGGAARPASRPGGRSRRASTATRSARRKASPRSWVTNSTAARRRVLPARNSSWIARRAIGSSAPNGSSMSTRRGSAASARATPTRWRWPPESSPRTARARTPRRAGRPSRAARRRARPPLPRRPAEQPRHRRDVLLDRPVREEAALLDDVADPAAQRDGILRRAPARRRRAPRRRPARAGGSRASARSSCPQPEGPTSATVSPSATDSVKPSSTGRPPRRRLTR